VALYRRAIDDGIEREQALRMVVDQLITETQSFE
jgi:glutamate---cysteine ligase / carboxylate-amine ligase